MLMLSLVWGIMAFAGMMIGFLPCMGVLNWLNIPFAGVGFAISIAALLKTKEPNNSAAIVGALCSGAAVVIGVIRLWLGSGIL